QRGGEVELCVRAAAVGAAGYLQRSVRARGISDHIDTAAGGAGRPVVGPCRERSGGEAVEVVRLQARTAAGGHHDRGRGGYGGQGYGDSADRGGPMAADRRGEAVAGAGRDVREGVRAGGVGGRARRGLASEAEGDARAAQRLSMVVVDVPLDRPHGRGRGERQVQPSAVTVGDRGGGRGRLVARCRRGDRHVRGERDVRNYVVAVGVAGGGERLSLRGDGDAGARERRPRARGDDAV